VLLDIEGTTTPIAFVHDVLFPFARDHLMAWCADFSGSTSYLEVHRRLAAEHANDRLRGESVPEWRTDTPNLAVESLVAYARWLMDRDCKSPGLKLLQGFIWEQGYRAGILHGDVFPDVPEAIRRWRDAGLSVAIYSSGSELAQRLLFASTRHGDLTPLITGFFDTSVGSKLSSDSYARIVSALGDAAPHALFASDVAAELSAAADAGCQTLLVVRPGNGQQPDADRFETVHAFSEIVVA